MSFYSAEIDILLATYNGEKYIDSQILSILSQTFQHWRLIIHDDGSSDNTVSIIKKYTKFDNRIVFIDDDCKMRDPGKHFIYMLRFSSSPYICFCDQDDIWFEYKLERMLNVINQCDNTKPQVVFSDAYLYYSKERKMGGKLLVTRPNNLKQSLFINGGIHGSASIFNKLMKEKLNDFCADSVAMHDHILTLIGCTYGQTSYMSEKLFLYRQHANNVTGNMEVSPIKRTINAFRSISQKYVLNLNTIQSVHAFLDTYDNELDEDDKILLIHYIHLTQMKPIRRFFSIIYNRYSLNGSKTRLWIKILTRKYLSCE